MAQILSIETATTICSACISKNGEMIAYAESAQANSHATRLTVMIQEVLKSQKMTPRDLDAVCISAGPGSYTGLRIGFGVAKGLCYALDIPLLRVSTLQALANQMYRQVQDIEGIYVPVIDARRDDIYFGAYTFDGIVVEQDQFATLNDKLFHYHDKSHRIYVGGNATLKCEKFIDGADIIFLKNMDCRASGMFDIAEKMYLCQAFDDLAYSIPSYLKEFEGISKSGLKN